MGRNSRGFRPQTNQYRFKTLSQLSWEKLWVDHGKSSSIKPCNNLGIKCQVGKGMTGQLWWGFKPLNYRFWCQMLDQLRLYTKLLKLLFLPHTKNCVIFASWVCCKQMMYTCSFYFPGIKHLVKSSWYGRQWWKRIINRALRVTGVA